MNSHGHLIRFLIASAAAITLLGASFEPRTAVARVNGVPVTFGELETEIDRLAPSSVAAHGQAGNSAALRQKALDELIVRELAYQYAKKKGLSISTAELKPAVDRIRGHYRSSETFRKALEAEQITEQEFLERVRKDLLLRKIYKREIDDKAVIRPSEVDEYYRQYKASYVLPESIWLMQIWVRGDRPGAKSRAEEAIEKLKSGTPFFDVAYRYSEDDYRVLGGDYGWVHRGQLSPEVEKVAFSITSKILVGPVRTSFGWHILRVQDHRAERQVPLAEAHQKITEKLHRERLAGRRAEFTRQLRENARIEYLAP